MSLSAKDFHNPLLRSLGRLSGWKPEMAIRHDETYKPVMAIMGIESEEEHGINASSGQPNVTKWIQWAFKNLKASGLTFSPSRGKWSLSEKGLEEARRLDAMTKDVQPTGSKEPEENLPPTPKGYPSDPYIVFLGSQSTPCFSHHSNKSPTCKTCPLQASCKNATWSVASSLARTL